MNVPAKNQVLAAIQTANELFHRLVLLVGETGSGKTTVLRAVAQDLSVNVVNVNLAVSAELLELTAKQRILRLPPILEQIAGRGSAPVLLDNLEILFDRHLQQDPLRLLQHISRNRTVVAAWGGSVGGEKLLYAELGHDEYRSYEASEALVVTLDRNTLVEPIE